MLRQTAEITRKKTLTEKVELIKRKKACWSCSETGYRSANCTVRKKCLVDSICIKYHHESFHQAHAEGIIFHAPITNKKPESVNEPLNNLQVNEGKFWSISKLV